MDAFLELTGEVYVTHQFFSNKHGDLSLFSVCLRIELCLSSCKINIKVSNSHRLGMEMIEVDCK